MKLVKPAQFKEAAAKLGSRNPVSSKLTSTEWARVPLALRERAFFSSTIENVQFLQRAQDLLGDFITGAREQVTLPDGTQTTALSVGGRAEFVQQARRFAIEQGMGPLDPEDVGTIKDIRSEQRLALIYEVQTTAAYEFGGWKQGLDPAVLDEFPAQRFIREVEVKEPRDLHASHEGVVRLKSDVGFWMGLNRDFGVPWGPWGWGCGHGVEDVDRAEAESLGLLQPGQAVESPEAEFNSRLQASTRGLDSDLVAWLKDQLGDSIVVDPVGDSVQWAPDIRTADTPRRPPSGRADAERPDPQADQPLPLPQHVARLATQMQSEDWDVSVVSSLEKTPASADALLAGLNIRPGGSGSYDPRSHTIEMSKDAASWSGRPRTLHHEVGHHLHTVSGTITNQVVSSEWAAAARKDLAAFKVWAEKRHPGKGLSFYDRKKTSRLDMLEDTARLYGAEHFASTSMDTQKAASAFLDTVMGLTRGARGLGHKPKYMKKYGDMEVFAHAYASLVIEDATFQQVFPKVVAEVKRVIKVQL